MFLPELLTPRGGDLDGCHSTGVILLSSSVIDNLIVIDGQLYSSV